MPIYEYKCPKGHSFELFFRTISLGADADKVPCKECRPEWWNDDIGLVRMPVSNEECAVRVPSIPLQPHLYGDPRGYNKPSPAKRHSYKLVSAKEGNKNSVC